LKPLMPTADTRAALDVTAAIERRPR